MAEGGESEARLAIFASSAASASVSPSAFRPPPSPRLLHRHHQIPLAQPQGQLDRLGQPRTDLRPGHQPVDHHLDVVPHLAVQPQVVAQADHAAVDPGAGESLLQQVGEQVAVFALLAADQRGQHREIACPAGRARIRSMICSRVWAVIGRPHCGQCPLPTRAYSTRR